VQLRELEREAASARTVYEQFLLRARETGEQGNINANNVQKISEARPADTPEGASRKLIVIGGAIAGFLAGLGLAMAIGMFDALKSRFNGGFSDPASSPTPTTPRGGAPRRRLPRLLPERTADPQPAFVSSAGPAMVQASAHYQQPDFTPQPVQPQYLHQPQQPHYVPQPVMPMHPYPQPMPIMQPVFQPVPMPMPPVMQAHGYSAPPMMQPAFNQPVYMQPPQMVPHQMQPVEHPSPSQREMRGIRETLDGLHAELAELLRHRRSA
jgi:polysaccharide biosynthesis transport protein